jgi:hypothetical protein
MLPQMQEACLIVLGYIWEDVAFTGKIDFASFYARRAERLGTWGTTLLLCSGLTFMPGSGFAFSSFITTVPASTLAPQPVP